MSVSETTARRNVECAKACAEFLRGPQTDDARQALVDRVAEITAPERERQERIRDRGAA